jgi:hypothetical protein
VRPRLSAYHEVKEGRSRYLIPESRHNSLHILEEKVKIPSLSNFVLEAQMK